MIKYIKNYIFIISIFILIFFNNKIYSQNKDWKIVDSLDYNSNAYMYKLKCVDSNNCIIQVEYNGTGGFSFRQTINGGISWKNVYIY